MGETFSKGRDVADDGQPRWIHLPIAEARLLGSRVEMPTYCESLRHQGQRRTATTFHAVINVPAEPDRVWFACAECTSLMMDGVDATVAQEAGAWEPPAQLGRR